MVSRVNYTVSKIYELFAKFLIIPKGFQLKDFQKNSKLSIKVCEHSRALSGEGEELDENYSTFDLVKKR